MDWSFWLLFTPAFIQALFQVLSYFEGRQKSVRGKNSKPQPSRVGVMVLLMFLTWGAVAFDYYDRRTDFFPKWPDPYSPISVIGRTFKNTEVPLDGHSYAHCTFEDVTFSYNGTTAVQISTSEINGFSIKSDNAGVLGTVFWLKGMGMLKSDVKLVPPSPGVVVEELK